MKKMTTVWLLSILIVAGATPLEVLAQSVRDHRRKPQVVRDHRRRPQVVRDHRRRPPVVRESAEQCITDLQAFLKRSGLHPSKEVYRNAVASCRRGDLQAAIAVLQREEVVQREREERCRDALNAFIERRELRPDRETVAQARRYCARGDIRGAVTVLQAAQGTPEPQELSAEQCINTLQKMGLWPPSKAVYGEVRAYCSRGDLRGAVTVMQNVGSPRDPQRDLSVTFASRPEGQGPGYVVGTVTNTSSTAYHCVLIEFNLSPRFDRRQPGQDRRHLGVLRVEVNNVSPRSVRDYAQRLPFPAGIGLKTVGECG